jgi:hypothetical protein
MVLSSIAPIQFLHISNNDMKRDAENTYLPATKNHALPFDTKSRNKKLLDKKRDIMYNAGS